MPAISDEQLKRLEWLLRRPIAQDEGCYVGFDQLSQSHIRDLAMLSKPGTVLDAIVYVRFLMSPPASLRNAMTFVDRVIRGGTPVHHWIAHGYHPD
jgi:hypothetical protein